MPEPTAPTDAPVDAPTTNETPAEAPAEQTPMSQAEIDALVDETLKEYLPPQPKTEEKPEPATAPELPEDKPETPEDDEEVELPEDEIKKEPKEEQPDLEGLFIEVEDAAGNKYKITKESDLPEDFIPKNNRQVIEILRQLDQLDQKRGDLELQKQQEAQAEAAEQRKTEVLQGWDNEIQSLIDNGILDAPKAKPGTKLWETDPAVQKADAVFKFMVEQNKARAESGAAPITSFAEAYMIQQAVSAKANEEAKIKADNATAKAKAGLVGRTSSPTSNEKVYTAGSARSIDDIEI